MIRSTSFLLEFDFFLPQKKFTPTSELAMIAQKEENFNNLEVIKQEKSVLFLYLSVFSLNQR
jgi:hypothetical protein